MPIQTQNPFNNHVLRTFDEFPDTLVEQKIKKSHQTFLQWKTTTFQQRAEILKNAASILERRKYEFAKLITTEMGKLIGQSESEIEMCARVLRYYADHSEAFLDDKPFDVPEGKAFVRYSPIGPILAVMPWNYPFNQVARIAAPNIMAGNTIVVKHASNVPQCALAIEELFAEAGAPDGLYTNIFLSGSKTSKLAANKYIAAVSLTGSENAGASLAAEAGANIKKSVLELGGSDAFIVLDDADLNLAVEKAFSGRFGNMGQACTSSKRLIVLKKVADDFLSRFQKRITDLKVGDPMDRETQIGPLSSESAVQKIEEQVNETLAAGAKAVVGGKRIQREGAFFEFTILTDIKPGMVAYHEEIFGPVASFYVVDDEEEAISLANDTSFGLGGSVFSSDIERAISVASQLETGMVFINEPSASRPELPFGGTKRSGYGRELSPLGIEEFVNKKLIRIAPQQ